MRRRLAAAHRGLGIAWDRRAFPAPEESHVDEPRSRYGTDTAHVAGSDIAQHQLSPGVVWRILRFAKPYRFLITIFVATVVVMSALAVAPPLLFKQIIDRGHFGATVGS